MIGPKYSVVIPIYRSERTLRMLRDRINAVFKKIGQSYELILVEDCGGDGSWEIMKQLHRLHPEVKIVRLTRNFGQHNALICGFSLARGEYIITMDDDLQNPPEEIPKLIDAIDVSENDVVYGIPESKRHGMLRNFGSRVFIALVSRIFEKRQAFGLSSFRIIRGEIARQVSAFLTPNPIIGPLLMNVTDRFGVIPVEHHPRRNGNSTYTTGKLIRHFLHGILYHSDFPLKAVSVMGICCLILCIVLSAVYLTRYIAGDILVSGWTTIVLIILFFSGIGMFSLGIVGEYLLRIIQEVKGMPVYIVRDKEL